MRPKTNRINENQVAAHAELKASDDFKAGKFCYTTKPSPTSEKTELYFCFPHLDGAEEPRFCEAYIEEDGTISCAFRGFASLEELILWGKRTNGELEVPTAEELIDEVGPAPELPEACSFKGKWNGKFYGKFIYLNGEKTAVTQEQIDAYEAHEEAEAAWGRKVKARKLGSIMCDYMGNPRTIEEAKKVAADSGLSAKDLYTL